MRVDSGGVSGGAFLGAGAFGIAEDEDKAGCCSKNEVRVLLDKKKADFCSKNEGEVLPEKRGRQVIAARTRLGSAHTYSMICNL